VHKGLSQSAGSDRTGRVIAAAARRAAGIVVLILTCLMPGVLSAAASNPTPIQVTDLTTPVDHNTDPVAAPSANTVDYPDVNNGSMPVTSAADLSLFGILALGIIGLLWVRRHTSEL
jgi:hypothetical protein